MAPQPVAIYGLEVRPGKLTPAGPNFPAGVSLPLFSYSSKELCGCYRRGSFCTCAPRQVDMRTFGLTVALA